ncbi:myosin-2 heavy chain-like [Helianthus annuus]|uniref:myosin-2 heavy chain-like n=1 Tax=Helianthus annuus TaxID=4232 RepID=UPI0016533D7A|nr:myosin-2 heavy chain-like [Helianthus annuus]
MELARHSITYTQEELVDKLFNSLPNDQDWQYFALMLKNTIKPPEVLTVDLLIERLESHELEIKKPKVNNTAHQQNVELYYRGNLPKAGSPRTAFSAESSNIVNHEIPHSGFHSGSSSTTSSQFASKNLFQCNIAVDLKNGQNFSEESAKQQMVFLASVLESYESLVAGFNWSELLPEEDAVGYAFVAKTEIKPYRDTRTEAEKAHERRQKAEWKMLRLSRVFSGARKAKRWNVNRECYLDPKGKIAIDAKTLSLEALVEEFVEQEEAQQREWWGGDEEKENEKEKEPEQKPKKIDEGIIDTTQDMTAENFGKMADKVNDLTKRVRKVEDQILERDRMLKFSNEQVKKLTEKIDNDKIEVERIRRENEKLIHENRQLSENFNKLKQIIQDSDDRNGKTRKENEHLTVILRHKEEQINKQLDEIAKVKLQFEEAKIENERKELDEMFSITDPKATPSKT